jgi:hypothetical protein
MEGGGMVREMIVDSSSTKSVECEEVEDDVY